jgi:hypothetical protein
MARVKLLGVGLILAALSVGGMSCSNRPPRLRPPAINATEAGARAVAMFDADKNGSISGAELDKCPGLKAAIARLDAGGQGVTAEAIAARIKDWQESKAGRLAFACIVTRNGAPLADAEVKFVPEPFLGSNMPVAVGKTDKNGMARISIPTSGEQYDQPGVPPGFYRVEITLADGSIPSKYNTETILGQEVAIDSGVLQNDIRLDLQF